MHILGTSYLSKCVLPGRVQVVRGVLYAPVEAEGRRLRNPFDTITEGVGLNRLTQNFNQAAIDGAFQCE